MPTATSESMPLEPEKLREVDEWILDLLKEKQCVTPVFCREEIRDRHGRDVTSTYCGQRLQELEKFDHVENLRGVGLYEIISDPRD